jgi:ZIP family zinc transporter
VVAVWVLGIACAAALATMTGGLLALNLRGKLHLVLGFSAGAVIGVAFFDLLPEALTMTPQAPDRIVLGLAAGFFLYLLFDRLVSHHHEPGGPAHGRGFFGAASFSAHSLLDGLGIGFAFQASHAIGLVVAAAVLAHDFADGLNTVNVVVKNNGTRKHAMAWLAVDALAPVAGAGLSLFVTVPPATLALVLAGFAGFFLYIGAVELLPESQRAFPRPWTVLSTLLGAGFLYAVTRLAM